jgi:hypothetical protein
MKRYIYLFLFCIFFLCGCEAYRATVAEMRKDPYAFFSNPDNISSAHWTNTNQNNPISDPWKYIALTLGGYGLCFLRKFYQNYKKLKADKKK